MTKNLIVCCDGTGNEINENISNVLKFYRVLQKTGKTNNQVVFYHPGIGTLAKPNVWTRHWQDLKRIFQLGTGEGLEEHVLAAYEFLIHNYEDGDKLYLFGFSRGAHTARVLAALIHKVGLLYPQQSNLASAAFQAYKNSPEAQNEVIQTVDDKATQFARIASTRWANIEFLGVWDTVASLFTPTGKLWPLISLEILPYTRRNPSVWAFRQAASLDERRRMFRLEPWLMNQVRTKNRFSQTNNRDPQDAKQVWFAGVHADVGGGYPENESGISKHPLLWLIDEAKKYGLKFSQANINHLVWGVKRKGSPFDYVAPSATELPHNSLSALWWIIEWIPKSTKYSDWKVKLSFLGWYLPLGEPRTVADGSTLHQSLIDLREARPEYRPINFPNNFETWPLPEKPKSKSTELVIPA